MLDNILNFRLEIPFTKFAEFGDNLPMLDPILIKSQLSNKIKIIINNIHSDEQIQNFIDENMEKNSNEMNNNINLDLLNKNRPIYRVKPPSSKDMLNKRDNFFINDKKGINNNKFNGNYIGYNNDMEKGKNNFDIFYKGDQLLNKNYFDFDKKLSNEPGYYKKTKVNIDLEKKKLESTIADLENECNIKNQIINQQELDIQQLKNKISLLEKKINFVFKK